VASQGIHIVLRKSYHLDLEDEVEAFVSLGLLFDSDMELCARSGHIKFFLLPSVLLSACRRQGFDGWLLSCKSRGAHAVQVSLQDGSLGAENLPLEPRGR
jgi:hypothetical protein